MDNFFITGPWLEELHGIGIRACGICRQQFQGFSNKLKVGKYAKLPYYF